MCMCGAIQIKEKGDQNSYVTWPRANMLRHFSCKDGQ